MLKLIINRFIRTILNLRYQRNEQGEIILSDSNKGTVCQFCNCKTELVFGYEIWPNRVSEVPRPLYLDYKFYRCELNTDHYVGTYSDNITALGSTADSNLRLWRNRGHQEFDPLWKDGPQKYFSSRKEAYDWLSQKMKLPIELTHFGMFNERQSRKAIDFVQNINE